MTHPAFTHGGRRVPGSINGRRIAAALAEVKERNGLRVAKAGLRREGETIAAAIIAEELQRLEKRDAVRVGLA